MHALFPNRHCQFLKKSEKAEVRKKATAEEEQQKSEGKKNSRSQRKGNSVISEKSAGNSPEFYLSLHQFGL